MVCSICKFRARIALGARHSAGKFEPPKNPMGHEEGKALVKDILEKALRDNRHSTLDP